MIETNNESEKSEEKKSEENSAKVGREHLNLDYIINTVSIAVSNNQNTQYKPYSKEYIEAYSNFISQYNQTRDSLF